MADVKDGVALTPTAYPKYTGDLDDVYAVATILEGGLPRTVLVPVGRANTVRTGTVPDNTFGEPGWIHISDEGIVYKKTETEWVGIGSIIGIGEAPVNNKLYVRKNGAWAELNDVRDVVTTTGVIDLSLSKYFQVDLSVPRTISFANLPPAGKSLVFTVELVGYAGVSFDPATTIRWSEDTVPELGAVYTYITFVWNGSVLTGIRSAFA
jgi:hypothetical protein